MTPNDINRAFMDFIQKSPTAFHVTANMAAALKAAGFTQLDEQTDWHLIPGGCYFVTRSDSALIAFRLPEGSALPAFRIMASHSDAPCFKLKENPELPGAGDTIRLNVELYGGALLAPWFDRPLSVAGRVLLQEGGGLATRLVDLDRDLVMIPSLAIHMNREANRGTAYNVQKDLLPLLGLGETDSIAELIAREQHIEADAILGSDLFLYNRDAPVLWGAHNEFLASPRLDDTQCAFASLTGFLNAAPSENIPVHCVFDNEEVGSGTKQGAAGTFLADTLARIAEGLGMTAGQYRRAVAGSFMLSADNAHAVHPNYPDKADPVNQPRLNGGVVLKFSANQKYTTDGRSAARCRLLAQSAGVPLQVFTNRSDMPGGSTLGNISTTQVSMETADVGIAQLAMHSPYECCGAEDTARLAALAQALFSE
jgi:aspartyl aminopeptidase